MGHLLFGNVQMAKMAFTDLIPMLLGASGTSFNVVGNVTQFFQNAVPGATAASAFSQFQENFESWDFIIGQVRNPVVQLFLNPESITVNKKVLYDKKQTRGGFVVQFWGHDLETIEVNAATAYFDVSKEPLAAFELLKRQCYQSRFHATQPYRGCPIIAMLFESQILKGYFTDFTFKINATQPYYFTYSFNFTVTENVAFFTSSNIANAVADVIKAVRTGGFNITRNQSDVSLIPEQYQFGRGWGVQLF